MNKGISTFPRFVFLNSYAFLLLTIGVGIAFVTYPGLLIWVICCKYIISLFCIASSLKIFFSWESKIRIYNVLMERNKRQFRADTFVEQMQAPCGRLLTLVVLHDIGHPEYYNNLKVFRKSLYSQISENLHKRTKITIYNKTYGQTE